MTKSNEIPKKPIKLKWDADPFSEPEHEPLPNKSMTILNNTPHVIYMLRLGSDWKSVNFAIESDKTPKHDRITYKKRKIMADLYPGDRIELIFHPPELIDK